MKDRTLGGSKRDFEDNDIVARARDLLTTDIDGELIAMSVSKGICYGLDAVGTRIWALIVEPSALSGIVDALVAEYEVAPEVCRVDVAGLLGELLDEGLVTVRPA